MTVNTETKLNITNRANNRKAYSLIEIITVMVIASIVIVCVVNIFHQIRTTTAAVNKKLDTEDVADEILQRIAEDLDRLAVQGFDTKLTLSNKLENGFNKCRLTIENEIYDKDSKPQTFEKVVWHAEFDTLEQMPILYRHHGGMCLEDKILDVELKEKQLNGTELFVPICWAMTHFEIVIPRKDAEPLTTWSSEKLPTSVAVKISFAEPIENIDGTFEVPQEDILTRYIAIDRTRKPRFIFKKKDFTNPELDPNEVDTSIEEDPTEPEGTGGTEPEENEDTPEEDPKKSR